MKYIGALAWGWILGVLLAHFVLRDSSKSLFYSDPGTPPQDVFHDGGEWYSKDGCWRLSDGYWRPLRRCHIVRVPTDTPTS